MEAALIPGARVTFRDARVPDEIAVVFSPLTRHLAVPLPETQERVFPAADTTGPGVIETAEIWEGE